ncbi:UDP-phosphate N-acetylgalactosaminyl-1-phosphate transferase [Fictibacillus arsenicus]|uniref:UDP-phosphate N-acetylgalactosaminyl-1-phosphate transferase n=1 Tax=Fictibacillus arsenicus TaxID=255247 RepID=A0A1B1Z958_9BACL|nr:exopolysaccharide biosynthesis polyprenyl glycosylphosphotransferase [Fictibacillus arsenicus]ANX13965.1 UDP-phosphate N-acetylgalactosaminyl-1-phosphate transferase [Fictibacillus arsenicus]
MGVKELSQVFVERQIREEINQKEKNEKCGYKNIKVIFDWIAAFLGLIFFLPILALFSILIKIESRGPVFYTQERVGLNGEIFLIYKLRSMFVNAEEQGPQWAKKNDTRITRVGMFIRKTRIDEIPQFINILKGEMSLIGPRPERPFFTQQFNNEIPGFNERIKVKPGLTGWAQVNGGYEINPKEKLELDLFYINNVSLYLDFHILIKTFNVIVTGNGAR